MPPARRAKGREGIFVMATMGAELEAHLMPDARGFGLRLRLRVLRPSWSHIPWSVERQFQFLDKEEAYTRASCCARCSAVSTATAHSARSWRRRRRPPRPVCLASLAPAERASLLGAAILLPGRQNRELRRRWLRRGWAAWFLVPEELTCVRLLCVYKKKQKQSESTCDVRVVPICYTECHAECECGAQSQLQLHRV